MASNTLIGIWSQGVWENLGQPDCLSYLTISGYAVQPNTIGFLNNKIGTCYEAVTGANNIAYDLSPDITSQELYLVGLKYEVDFYRHLSMSTMGMGAGGIPWISIKESDESITRVNAINLGREYREMSKDAQLVLDKALSTYIQVVQGGGTSRDVVFLSPAYYPRPYSTVVNSRE